MATIWRARLNSPRYLDLISRAMQFAFKDRLIHMADPNFYDVPVEMLISPEYAAEARHLIESGEDRRSSPRRCPARATRRPVP